MKKNLLLFSFFLCTIIGSTAQNVVVPDSIFKNYLLTNPAINTDGDTAISFAEAAAFTDTLNLWHFHVRTLVGVEKFINITGLDCEGECCGYVGMLTSLDVSQCTKLKFLNCFNNQLRGLDITYNTALEVLNCESNFLHTLDVTHNTLLKELYCSSDSLSAIDVTQNTALQQFQCVNNSLTSLDVTHNTALISLYCSNNPLISFDVSHNLGLQELLCVSDSLTSLNVSKNLALGYFYCFSNRSLASVCVNSISSADSMETASAYVKDATSAWSEACNAVAGINEVSTVPIIVSPNPSNGQFMFSGFENEYTIEVYDYTGRLLYESASDDKNQIIDLTGKSSGIYLYRITDKDNKVNNGKIILQ